MVNIFLRYNGCRISGIRDNKRGKDSALSLNIGTVGDIMNNSDKIPIINTEKN